MEMIGKYKITRDYHLAWATFATYNGVTKTVALNPYIEVTEDLLDKVFNALPRLC